MIGLGSEVDAGGLSKTGLSRCGALRLLFFKPGSTMASSVGPIFLSPQTLLQFRIKPFGSLLKVDYVVSPL